MYNKLRKDKDKIFIPFFMIGDPDYNTSLDLILSACEAGVDAIELGIPYSDPVADGPVIQKANIRGINAGINLEKVFTFISDIRAKAPNIPIGLLTYYNIIFSNKDKNIIEKLAKSGVNSIVVADLIPELAEDFTKSCKENKIDNVFLISGNTKEDRFHYFNELGSGFVYLVSIYGVTGERQSVNDKLSETIQTLKNKINLPICVGFGISNTEHAKLIYKSGAWGVIVGSAIVRQIEENLDNTQKMKQNILNFIESMLEAKNP